MRARKSGWVPGRNGSGHVGRRSHGREVEAGTVEAGTGHRDTGRVRAAATAAGDGVHLGREGEADPGDPVRASRRLKESSKEEEALRPAAGAPLFVSGLRLQ